MERRRRSEWHRPVNRESISAHDSGQGQERQKGTSHAHDWRVLVAARFFLPCTCRNRTTTWAIAALSRLRPSGVFAFSPTQLAGTPKSSETWVRIAAEWGPILGTRRIRLASMLAMA